MSGNHGYMFCSRERKEKITGKKYKSSITHSTQHTKPCRKRENVKRKSLRKLLKMLKEGKKKKFAKRKDKNDKQKPFFVELFNKGNKNQSCWGSKKMDEQDRRIHSYTHAYIMHTYVGTYTTLLNGSMQ